MKRFWYDLFFKYFITLPLWYFFIQTQIYGHTKTQSIHKDLYILQQECITKEETQDHSTHSVSPPKPRKPQISNWHPREKKAPSQPMLTPTLLISWIFKSFLVNTKCQLICKANTPLLKEAIFNSLFKCLA